MKEETRRMFLGLEVHAPWPAEWPEGRLIEESHRHLTLAFLGQLPLEDVKKALPSLPAPPFAIAPCGQFVECLHLNRVVAWRAEWFDEELLRYQKQLSAWMKVQDWRADQRPWLSHATICREPCDARGYIDLFKPLPLFAGPLHLYESLGHSRYRTLWSLPLLPPFEEIEHTADIAFRVRGENLQKLYESAFTALAFRDPHLLNSFEEKHSIASVDEIVILLNRAVSSADRKFGCPLKAVSFHGDVKQMKNHLEWEMIVDV